MSDKSLPAHSNRGPSSGDRWIYRADAATGQPKGCPGSVRRSKDAPDFESVYAAEGTAAHWVSDVARKENKPASEYLNYTHAEEMKHPDGGSFICDQEMVDGVQYFLDYVNAIPCTAAYFEEKVTYMEWVPGDGFGTADDIRFDDDKKICYVTDLKYGKGIQNYATDNIQLMLYALGVYEQYSMFHDFDQFVLAICQPRLDHIDEWKLSLKDLLNWAEQVVKPAAQWTEDPDAPINPGVWCRWCRVKQRCRERVIWALTIGNNFQSEMISNDELSQILPLLSGVKKVCGDLEELALKEALNGAKIHEHKVVEGRSNRKWLNEKKVKKSMLKHGFSIATIIDWKIISPTAFEKLAGKKHSIMKLFVDKPPGKPTLVSINDKRPVFSLDAEKEFADFDEFADFEEINEPL